MANPISGAGRNRVAAPRLARALEERGVTSEVAFTERRGHAVELAAGARARGFDAVVAVGGDGTLREVAEGLAGALPAAVHPTGTANVLAREIAMPFDARGTAGVIAAGLVETIDTARVGARRALFVVGAGLDGAIVHALEEVRRGAISYASYLRPIARTLLRWRPAALRVRIDGGEALPCAFAIVSNTRHYAGPWVRFARGPSLQDGRFEVYRFETPTRGALVAAGLRGLLGALPGGRVVRDRCERVRIESDAPVPVQIDGDAAGSTPVDLVVEPRALPLLVPPSFASAEAH